jgi:hypothetical protein
LKHPAFELYRLENDPYETENLAGRPEYGPLVGKLFSDLRKELDLLDDELGREKDATFEN